MSTVVGLRCRDGVVVAGDRLLVRDGRVVSRGRQRVFSLGDVAVAVLGSDVDRFRDRVETDLKRYRLERGEPSLAAVERITSDVARDVGSDAIVAARDEDGTARALAIHADGSVLDDPPLALGSGASLALGQLEALDADALDVDEATASLADLLERVAERDTRSGDVADVEALRDV